jgi:hypothetical protein
MPNNPRLRLPTNRVVEDFAEGAAGRPAAIAPRASGGSIPRWFKGWD